MGVKVGTHLILSNGVYSDKWNIGIAVVLKEFDDEYLVSTKLRDNKLQEHLVKEGYIEVIEHAELWLAEEDRGYDWGTPQLYMNEP